MLDRMQFLLERIGERLWIKPLLVCLFSCQGRANIPQIAG